MQQIAKTRTRQESTSSNPAARRRISLRIADSLVVIGIVASYATSGRAIWIHATVGLVFTALVAWHFWLHRAWFKSAKKRLAKNRSRKSRRSAFVTVLIAVELTIAITLGIAAWLVTGLLSGPHTFFANALIVITVLHVILNLKQLKVLIRRRSIVVDRRFRGSKNEAQSGYAAGEAGSFAEGTAQVVFTGPVPLDKVLTVEVDPQEHLTVLDGSQVVMEVTPNSELQIGIGFDNHIVDEVFARGPVSSPGHSHTAHCFGCSLERSDGLGITTMPIGESGMWGTTWTPHESLPSTGEFVNDEIVWAALDCPGSFAAAGSSLGTTGLTELAALTSMTVQIKEPVRIGEEVAVIGWNSQRSNEWTGCGVAIVDRDHRIKAQAHLTYGPQESTSSL